MSHLSSLIHIAQSADVEQDQRHAAFGDLVRQYQSQAYIWAAHILDDSHLAEEAVQEAFIIAYQKLAQLREPSAFPGWFKQIVRTAAYRLVRKKSLPAIPIADADDLPAQDESLESRAEHRDLREQVLAAIAQLPAHERVVVELFYIEGYSQREVAEGLTLPLSTVKKRLQYARARLRESIVSANTPTLALINAPSHPPSYQFVDALLVIGFALLETMPIMPIITISNTGFACAQATSTQFSRQINQICEGSQPR